MQPFFRLEHFAQPGHGRHRVWDWRSPNSLPVSVDGAVRIYNRAGGGLAAEVVIR